MRDGKEQGSSFDAATPEPAWNGFDDRSVTRENDGVAEETVSPRSERKPYRKPSYRFEKVFETMALSCGKITATQFQCRFHKHNS
jgi:hypothetical protein